MPRTSQALHFFEILPEQNKEKPRSVKNRFLFSFFWNSWHKNKPFSELICWLQKNVRRKYHFWIWHCTLRSGKSGLEKLTMHKLNNKNSIWVIKLIYALSTLVRSSTCLTLLFPIITHPLIATVEKQLFFFFFLNDGTRFMFITLFTCQISANS